MSIQAVIIVIKMDAQCHINKYQGLNYEAPIINKTRRNIAVDSFFLFHDISLFIICTGTLGCSSIVMQCVLKERPSPHKI